MCDVVDVELGVEEFVVLVYGDVSVGWWQVGIEFEWQYDFVVV